MSIHLEAFPERWDDARALEGAPGDAEMAWQLALLGLVPSSPDSFKVREKHPDLVYTYPLPANVVVCVSYVWHSVLSRSKLW